jgi:muramoyltetrapeptide carboxypeptidase
VNLPGGLIALLRQPSPCFLATVMPGGSPQLTQTWAGTDGGHVVINTVRGHLVSLLQQPAFAGVRGLVIGRFQKATGMTRDLLAQVVGSKPELAGLPVIANVDFGHTTPIVTFPVGGTVEVRAERRAPRLAITSH